MAGANAVFKGALGRTKSGSNFGGSRGTRHATVRQSNKDRAHGLALASAPNTHMQSGGTTGIPQFPTATAERRTFRGYAPKD